MEETYGLREKKAAKTKINLCRLFIGRLARQRFQEISIRGICEEAEVSEATFYNYFPRKEDVLYYYIHLSDLELAWHLIQKEGKKTAIDLIEEAVYWKNSKMSDPNLFFEILSVFASEKKCLQTADLTRAEKHFAFPEHAGIEDVPVAKLEDVFADLVQKAVTNGEIDVAYADKDVARFIFSLFIGTFLSLDPKEFSSINKVCRKQFELLWTMLGVSKA